ncbi:MAG: hypothetical protein JO027_21185 [Solirubrobacterales bacterium]|nr:hypothetical protein [Solirubrobacterales bacterium]
MQRSLKRQLVIGLAALAVAAFAGGAYAATQSFATNSRQEFLNDVAKRLHVTPQQLTAALTGATLDQLQAAVKAGRLTQAQANALAQRLKQSATAPAGPFGPGLGFGLGPRFARPGGPGYPGFPAGPGYPGGPGNPAGPGPGFLGGPFAGGGELQAAASYLGLTVPQLFQELSSGKSLAQIATSKGKSPGGLEQAMTSAVKARLDKLVADKYLTAAQEKTVLSRLSARLANEIDQKGLSFTLPAFRAPNGVPVQPRNVPVPPAYTPAPYPAPSA